MARGRATKDLMARTALRLFVEKGVRETTIRDIAAAASVAEGTLYRHYASKEDLAESLFTESYEAMAAELEAVCRDHSGLRAALGAMVELFCRAYDGDAILFRYLLLSQHRYLKQRDPNLPSPFNVVRRAIVEAMARGEIPKRDPEIRVAMVMGIVLQPAISKVYGRIEADMSSLAEELSNACWQVLSA
jgi:AcrR family transcriptional regulator